MKILRDTWLVFTRQIKLLVRQPIWLIVGIVQPIFYLLLFAPLVKPALQVRTDAEAYQVFVPGLLVMIAIFGSLFTGFGLIAELRAGIIERSRVTPVSRTALLLGRSLRDIVALLVQSLILVVLALPFGLRIAPADLLLALLLLALISLLCSALSYWVALKVRSEDALAPLLNTVSQPVLLTAGILLPLLLAPAWLLTVAKWNPFYWAVEGVRALFAGTPNVDAVWISLAVLGGLTLGSVTLAARGFAKSVR
jgi:ABC-2 type transport system permease protein